MAVKKTKGDKVIKQQSIAVVTAPVQMGTSDIATWKSALNSARTGRRSALYKLYENLLPDGVFSRSIAKRTEAITNAELVFTDVNGDPVQEINDLIDTPEFEHLLSEIMAAKAWGVSVIDILSALPFACFSVPRRNLNFAKKLILPDESSETGLSYEGNPYIFEVTNSEDPLGYIYKAAPYVIYKRGGYGDWAQFVELFGMPFRLGKYSAYDTNTRDELIKSLQQFGGAPWAVVPKEADIEHVQNNVNGNGDLYDKFLDRCDKEILITVLGQTMTTVAGSSKAQSQTHKDVEEDINKSDRKFTRRILNRHVLPVLEMAGLPVKGGKFTFPEQGESMSTAARVDIAIKIKSDGIPVSDDYIYEISGVRKPENGEVVSRSKVEAIAPGQPAPDPKDKNMQPSALARVFSFFAQALLGGRAPLKY